MLEESLTKSTEDLPAAKKRILQSQKKNLSKGEKKKGFEDTCWGGDTQPEKHSGLTNDPNKR